MAVANKLTLKFDTSSGQVFSIPIQNANPNVSQGTVTQAMEDIMENNIFTSTMGKLDSIKGAELTKTETTNINITL